MRRPPKATSLSLELVRITSPLITPPSCLLILLLFLIAGDTNVVQNFGEAWLAAFRGTEVFTLWDRITDPVIFDIVEPR